MNKFLQIIESVALVAVVIGAIALPGLIWDFSFDNYIKILDILIWPLALLMSMSFFRKVFTYIFFNLDQFNFFGTKGELKKIEDVIKDESLKLYNAEKKEKELKESFESSEREYQKRLKSLKTQKLTEKERAEQNLELADTILKKWQKTIEDLSKLSEENQKLRDLLDRKGGPITESSDSFKEESGSTSDSPNIDQNN